MNCEDCLLLLEEFFDEKLDGPKSTVMREHLAACAVCAGEYAELQYDHELYAGYQSQVEVTPAAWPVVWARVEQGRRSLPSNSFRQLRATLAGIGFRPAFASVLLLLAGGLYAARHNGLLRPLSPGGEPAARSGKKSDERTAVSSAEVSGVTPSGSSSSDGGVKHVPEANTETARHEPAKQLFIQTNHTGEAARRLLQRRLPVPRALPRLEQAQTPMRTAESMVERGSTSPADSGLNEFASDDRVSLDYEMARHAGQTQVLLRSFSNEPIPENAAVLNISYDKRLLRTLLSRNIFLRRETENRGDLPAEKLLSELEPILIDIANLPERASASDVRSIKEQLQKTGFISSLHLYSTGHLASAY